MEKPLSEYRWPDARDELAEIVTRTTPSERLAWVEEMLDIAYAAGALQRALQLETAEGIQAIAT